MSEEVTSIKFGQGFDAPWHVPHGDTDEEIAASLRRFIAGDLPELIAQAAVRAQAAYAMAKSGATPVVDQPAQQVVVQPQQQAAPPLQIVQPPVNTTPNNEYIQPSKYGPCAHGAPVWKDFTSKAGKPIKGWFCPSRDRTDCPPDFRN